MFHNRLKEIHFDITPETSIELLTGFIGRQLNLQHLDVEVCGYNIFAGLEVLQDFVYSHKSCRNLKVFKLSCSVNLVWRTDWFVLLAKSSLHTLALECCQLKYIGSENSCINKTLKFLQFCERCPERIKVYNFHVTSFLRAFTALEKLELAGVTAEIMYAVNKYQVRNTFTYVCVVKEVITLFTRTNINFENCVPVYLERSPGFSNDE